MEINEARKKLSLLQETIETAMNNFTRETGLEVGYVDITNIYSPGRKTAYSYIVNADVKLLPDAFKFSDRV